MKTIAQLKADLKAAQAALEVRDNKAGRMDDALQLPALPPALWKLLIDEGFKTGSEVYAPGIESADEDWCIAISPNVFSGYASGIGDGDYFETDGFASLYAHDGEGKIVNILCFGDYALFESWYMTTRTMQILMNYATHEFTSRGHMIPVTPRRTVLKQAFETKWKRVRLFNALRDILWPVKALMRDLDKGAALKAHKCKRCGRKAEFFSCWPEKKKYLDTGVCERCAEEHVQQNNLRKPF